VFNFHTHPDHVGGNHEFERVLAIDTEYTRRHAREGFSHETMRDQVAPDALCRPLPPATDPSSYRVEPWRISGTIRDGQRIDLGGRTLEVLRIPGHAPDAAALLDRERGLLFTGDTFYEGPIYLFGEATDLQAYETTVERPARLAPSLELLLPGHNTPASAPRMLVSLEEALAAVTRGEVEGESRPGDRVEYVFERFTLLMKAGAGG
ncbi:MAG: MBL fold metallo-hydrolase, partial [Gemmatimonadetes bacterium]|nr:MBL fold metallo-hydrolase [Gemmatimonadota bacterium]NIR80093.1 MBL fold metallo-hydrolase [Gemmatimonadota bacterium]NIT88844.1 MBL fold metallo-hydrolase [Gemmatimonadota bacterium]NIU32647.1 MBL fold metallo-hydrolase [Gemmatimonadota bacterium]NIU37088.1 MBL fold metallo-hydrolase [Gemmatimonadota bacterium]